MGCDYDNAERPIDVGPSAKIRLQRASTGAFEELKTKNTEVIMVFAPGCEPTRRYAGAETMASMMASSFVSIMPTVQVISNTTDQSVWGSMGEVEWAWAEIKKHRYAQNNAGNSRRRHEMSGTKVVFVSNQRHLRRVRKILKLFHNFTPYTWLETEEFDLFDQSPEGIIEMDPFLDFWSSEETPPSRSHEFKAHCRMYAHYYGWGERFDELYRQVNGWYRRSS